MFADSTIKTGIKLVLETMPFTTLKNKAKSFYGIDDKGLNKKQLMTKVAAQEIESVKQSKRRGFTAAGIVGAIAGANYENIVKEILGIKTVADAQLKDIKKRGTGVASPTLRPKKAGPPPPPKKNGKKKPSPTNKKVNITSPTSRPKRQKMSDERGRGKSNVSFIEKNKGGLTRKKPIKGAKGLAVIIGIGKVKNRGKNGKVKKGKVKK